MITLAEDATSDLPAIIRTACQNLLLQIAEKMGRVAARDRTLIVAELLPEIEAVMVRRSNQQLAETDGGLRP